MNFCYGLAMRHFCSTTTKPKCENRAVLAHKALLEQPERVQKKTIERLSSFFAHSEYPSLGDGWVELQQKKER